MSSSLHCVEREGLRLLTGTADNPKPQKSIWAPSYGQTESHGRSKPTKQTALAIHPYIAIQHGLQYTYVMHAQQHLVAGRAHPEALAGALSQR